MARIVVLQHHDHQHAGRLGRTLNDHGFRLDVRRPDIDPASVPGDTDDLHGLLVLGGPQHVDQSHPFFAREMALIRAMHERERPVLGVCLGSQLITKALGGSVERIPEPELGFGPVHIEVPGQTETVLAGVPWTFPVMHAHSYATTKPAPGTTVLAKSDRCTQVYKVGIRTYGFQFHLECDIPMASGLFDLAREEIGVDRAEFDAGLQTHAEMFDRTGDRICQNLAAFAFAFDELMSV